MKFSYKKAMVAFIASLIVSITAQANDLVGQWQGNMAVGQQSVPIIFNVSKQNGELTATMDSPMQGATGIPVKSVDVEKDQVVFSVAVAGARYEAQLSEGELSGTWKQSGQAFPLKMAKGAVESLKKN